MPKRSNPFPGLIRLWIHRPRGARGHSFSNQLKKEFSMRKLIAAVLLLSASSAAFAAAPAVMQAMADCTGSCPDCPQGK
jgi:hypothetical protein